MKPSMFLQKTKMGFTMQGARQEELVEEDERTVEFVSQEARNEESLKQESRLQNKKSQRRIKEFFSQEDKSKGFFSHEEKRQETREEELMVEYARTVHQGVRSGETLEQEDRRQVKESQHSINHKVKNSRVISHLFWGK